MKFKALLVSLLFSAAAVWILAAETNRPATVRDTHDSKEIIARVNGREVRRESLNQAMQAHQLQLARSGRPVSAEDAAQLQSNAFEDVVNRELVLQEATAHPSTNVTVKTAEALDKMKLQFGGEEGFKKALQQNGMTQDEFVTSLRENVMIQESMDDLVNRSVKLGADEAQDFYKSNPDKFKEPEMVRASHVLILVATDAPAELRSQKKAQILAVRSLLQNGEKFADVAKKYSEDTYSARNGGDLGPFARGVMVPEFDQAAFSLKTNELSDVIETKFGYHIIKVTEHIPPHQRAFADAKADIEKFLRYRKGSEIVQQHVKELRGKAKVEKLVDFTPVADASAPSAAPTNTARKAPSVETPAVAAPKK